MGKKIGDLYYSIGGDTKDLQASLGKSKDLLSGLKGTMTGVGAAFNGIGAQLGLVAGATATAFKYTKQAIDSVVDPTMNLALQVRDLARASGMGAEETSKLIQVFDDLNVDVSVLDMALRKMSQEGITFSVEKMAEMSDAYLKLAPGAERNKYLLDAFGRSGLDMARAMDAGGEAIKKMASEMDDSLILTQDNVDAAREYEIQLDELDDAVLGIKVSIGNQLIPVLTQAAKLFTDTSDAMVAAKDAADKANNPMAALAYEVDKLNTSAGYAMTGIDDMTASWATNYQESLKVIPVIQETTSSIISADSAMQSYSKTLLYNLAAQDLDSEAALQLAYSMGLVDTSTVYATEKLGNYQDMLDAGQISVDQYRALVNGLANELDRITDRTANISINYDYNGYSPTGEVSATPRAAGGPTMDTPFQWKEYGRMEQYMKPGENGGFVQNAQQMVEAMRAAGIAGGGAGIQIANVNIYSPSSRAFDTSIRQIELLSQ